MPCGNFPLTAHRARILASITPEIFSRNLNRLYSAFREVAGKGSFAKIFPSVYKETKAEISYYYTGAVPPDAQILTDLLDACDYLAKRDVWALRTTQTTASTVAPVWEGEDTDPALNLSAVCQLDICRAAYGERGAWLPRGRWAS